MWTTCRMINFYYVCVDDLNSQVDQHIVWHMQLAEYVQEEFCLPVSFIFFHVLFLYYYVLLLGVMRSESESDTYLGFDMSSYWIFFLHCIVSSSVGTYFRTPTEFNFTFSSVLLGVFLAMFKFAIPFDL